MTTCPVCEHSQAQGEACEVCGKEFGPRRVVDAPVQALPELEQTGHAGGRAAVTVIEIDDLEETRSAPVAAVAVEVVVDLEATRANPTPDVVPEAFADLDSGRAASDGVRTPVPPAGAVACRYCRIVQLDGLLCDNCGMRLPRVAAPAVAGEKPAASEDGWTHCPQCKTRARLGRSCPSCGTFVKDEE